MSIRIFYFYITYFLIQRASKLILEELIRTTFNSFAFVIFLLRRTQHHPQPPLGHDSFPPPFQRTISSCHAFSSEDVIQRILSRAVPRLFPSCFLFRLMRMLKSSSVLVCICLPRGRVSHFLASKPPSSNLVQRFAEAIIGAQNHSVM